MQAEHYAAALTCRSSLRSGRLHVEVDVSGRSPARADEGSGAGVEGEDRERR